MDLSIVIPTLGRPVLHRALRRLARQRGAESFEVLLVRDPAGEPAGALEGLAARAPFPARTLDAERPGASAARNVGWRAAAAPLVLFLGDDGLAGRRLVAEHLSWHADHPDERVGVLGHVRWARRLRTTAFMRWLDRGIQFDYGAIRGIEAGWGSFYTANASLKRVLLERSGGFDERLPFLYEDLDLALRLERERGFRLLYNRRAVVEHLHAPTLEEWRARMARVAVAERQFVGLHPGVEPYFFNKLREAEHLPRSRGRVARAANWVPRWVPWLGPRVWAAAEWHFLQELAPPFLAAWEEAGGG